MERVLQYWQSVPIPINGLHTDRVRSATVYRGSRLIRTSVRLQAVAINRIVFWIVQRTLEASISLSQACVQQIIDSLTDEND